MKILRLYNFRKNKPILFVKNIFPENSYQYEYAQPGDYQKIIADLDSYLSLSQIWKEPGCADLKAKQDNQQFFFSAVHLVQIHTEKQFDEFSSLKEEIMTDLIKLPVLFFAEDIQNVIDNLPSEINPITKEKFIREKVLCENLFFDQVATILDSIDSDPFTLLDYKLKTYLSRFNRQMELGIDSEKSFDGIIKSCIQNLAVNVCFTGISAIGIKFHAMPDMQIIEYPEDLSTFLESEDLRPILKDHSVKYDVVEIGKVSVYILNQSVIYDDRLLQKTLVHAFKKIGSEIGTASILMGLDNIILKTIEWKDRYTGQHSDIVGRLSKHITEAYKAMIKSLVKAPTWNEIQIDDIKELTEITDLSHRADVLKSLAEYYYSASSSFANFAGRMHDLGKTSIPTETLREELDYDVFKHATLQSHTFYGHNLLKDALVSKTANGNGSQRIVKNNILEHLMYVCNFHHVPDLKKHHYYNESSEHKNIKKDLLPNSHLIEIVHFADLFHSLVSDRPYRKAWPLGRLFNFIEMEIHNEISVELAVKNLLDVYHYYYEVINKLLCTSGKTSAEISWDCIGDYNSPVTCKKDIRIDIAKACFFREVNAEKRGDIYYLVSGEFKNPFAGIPHFLLRLASGDNNRKKLCEFLNESCPQIKTPIFDESADQDILPLLKTMSEELLKRMRENGNQIQSSEFRLNFKKRENYTITDLDKQETRNSMIDSLYSLNSFVSNRLRGKRNNEADNIKIEQIKQHINELIENVAGIFNT